MKIEISDKFQSFLKKINSEFNFHDKNEDEKGRRNKPKIERKNLNLFSTQ